MIQFRLGDISLVFNGKTPSEIEHRSQGFPVLKIKDVNESGVFIGEFDSFVDNKFVNGFSDKIIQENDIMILNAAHNADYVGSKLYLSEKSVVGSLATGEWLLIRANNNKVEPAYIYYWLQTPKTKCNLRLLVKGIHLYPKDVAELHIPLPSLTEQQRITNLLTKADRIRCLRRTTRQLSETYLSSVFLEMFGNPITNPNNYPLEKFGDIGNLERGISKNRPRNAPELYGGPYPFIQTGDVANASGYIRAFKQTYSKLGLQQSKIWPKGTLCITIAANIAKTAVLTFNACFPDSIVGFTPGNKTNTGYIQFWLSFIQKNLEDNAPESAQKNINLEILRNLLIPLPPLNLQNEFAVKAIKFTNIQVTFRESERQAEHLFQSILQGAFAGKL